MLQLFGSVSLSLAVISISISIAFALLGHSWLGPELLVSHFAGCGLLHKFLLSCPFHEMRFFIYFFI